MILTRIGLASLLFFTAGAFATAGDCLSILSGAHGREIDIQREIARSGLNIYQAELQNVADVVDVYEFYRKYLKTKGYLLGVDSLSEATTLFRDNHWLKHWSEFYRDFHTHPKANNHTATVMQKLVESNLPIVFLVPPDLMKNDGFTRDEMIWFLQDPKVRLKNVVLVFGAYDFAPAGISEAYSRSRDSSPIFQILEAGSFQFTSPSR